MQSIGDDTLADCMKSEANIHVMGDESNIDKYFNESIAFHISKEGNNATELKPLLNQKNVVSNNVSNSKNPSKRNTSKCISLSKTSLTVSKTKTIWNAEISGTKQKLGNNSSTKVNSNVQTFGKENLRKSNLTYQRRTKANVALCQAKKSNLTQESVHKTEKSESNSEQSSKAEIVSINLPCTNATQGTGKSIEISSYLSTIPTQERHKLSAWGLPSNILQKYEARGVTSMFPWQVECLSNHKVIEQRCNLVYSAPTSAGKTLVAELLVIKTVLETKRKVIFILPFVSVVREKMYYFQDLLSDSGISVKGFMGGITPPGGFAATHVAIATIEKANSLVNRLMEENELVNLGAVVIDELHLVGDPHRGYLLELLLTKLKYMSLKNDNINIQLIGMSATLPNLSLLAEWLNAELYKTDFRPVPLNEQCKIENTIYDNKLNFVRELKSIPELTADTDNVLQLCLETIADGHSILIFCPTKNWCEKLAEQIAFMFLKLGREDAPVGRMLRQQLNSELISETLEQLKRSPTGLDSILKNTVSFGIAFHHAGLTMDERDILEGSFRSGSLRVLVATSTLSSGVNLPARRVLIRTPMFGGKLLDSLSYKQMIGRAGRMGKDTAGESILMCRKNERKAAETLLSASLEPISSCLENSLPLIRALLEAVASEVVYTRADVETYAKCTLVSLNDQHDATNPAEEAIKFLVDHEFLLLQKTDEEHRWVATALGKACLAASVPPKDGLFLLEELQKARRCFVLDTELHIVYLVTPLNSGSQISAIDWIAFSEIWRTLSESERRVGQLVGVEERFLTSAMRGIVRPGKTLNIHRRFYTALALHDLVRETPLSTVCKRYGCCRGVLQSLQQSAATFAGMVTQFCKQLGWDCMELLVSQFQARLQFGVSRELLDLLRLPMLNGVRARSLYKHGITCIAELAVANELDVERALHKAVPFESEKEQDGEHEWDAAKRKKIRTVFVTGKDGLTAQEAAVLLVQEARTLVKHELKLQDLQWNQSNQSSITSESSVRQSSFKRGDTFASTSRLNIETNNCVSSSNSELRDGSRNNVSCEKSEIKNSAIINENNETSGDKNNSLIMSDIINEPEINMNTASHLEQLVPNSKQDTKKEESIAVKPLNQTLRLIETDFDESFHRQSSLDFFNDTDPMLPKSTEEKRNSESLITSRTQRKQNKADEETHNTEDTSEIPAKKLKPHSEDAGDNNSICSNSILAQMPLEIGSESPSLFDDSLNIDTQICNILEQNIIGTLEFSDFNASKFAEYKSPPVNQILSKTKDTVESNNTEKMKPETVSSGKRVLRTSSVDVPPSQGKPNVFSWKDDSWNDTKEIMNKLNKLTEKNAKDTPTKCNIRDIKNINAIIETPKATGSTASKKKISDTTSQKLLHDPGGLKKLSYNQRLAGVPAEKSPIANVIVFDRKRTASIDSNKSDSDDIIVPSQNIEIPMNIQLRSKLYSEKKQKRNSENAAIQLVDPMKKPLGKHKQILTTEVKCKIPIEKIKSDVKGNKDCSGDSIVPNSDEDTPVNGMLQKTKIILKKTQYSSETCTRKSKVSNDVNETLNWSTLNIIKVGSSRGTFNLFKREVLNQRYISLALSCETYTDDKNLIGLKVISSTTGERRKRSKKLDNYVHEEKKLCGASISWETNISYYISFSNTQDSKVPGKEQFKLFKDLLSMPTIYVKCFATKEVYRTLYQCCEMSASCRFLDPKVASWLQDSNACEKSYQELVTEYFPQGCFMLKQMGSGYDIGPGLNLKSTLPGEFRASVEAVLTWHITDALLDKLEKLSPTLLYTFKEIEMRTVTLLACMELTGLGVSLKSLQDLSCVVRNELASLEEQAFSLAGRKFNFSSSKEVAEVIGLCKGKKAGVNKAVLQQSEHPISNLVMLWRKLNGTQSKMIYPLLNQVQNGTRIHGSCVTCTVTGRVAMHEPNLQNVPKDFKAQDDKFVISVRMAFVPAMGNIMLSADYCQLELRILAHFSKDPILCNIMRKPGDIFKSIAAKWNHISEDQVDDEMRQRTKQLCYGMIYGMGTRTLAETLSIDELKAKEFLESFMNAYQGIRQWLNNVVEEACTNGYVTTLLERRRLLPGLSSTIPSEKSQAERQAVNTKVQGSAADIVKKAMINIEDRMRYEFPNSPLIMPSGESKRKLRSNSREAQQRGAYLLLQLHDELLYEVNMEDIQQAAHIVKESMEQVCHLAVPLPVKLRVGPAWGDLTEYTGS